MVARRVGGNRVPPSCEPGQQDAGDHEGPPNPSSTTLAPTDGPASCLTSRLRVMRMGPSRPRPYARPSRSQIDVYWRLM